MTIFTIDVAKFGFDETIKDLAATEAQVKIAAVRAINKTAIWLKTMSAKEISQAKNLQLKLVRQRLKITKPNQSNLRSFVMASLYGVRAKNLGAMRQTITGTRAGKYQFPHSFIAKMKSGHTGIYRTKTKSRLPIEEVRIALEPESSNIIRQLVDSKTMEQFSKYFHHELKFATRRIKT